MWLLNIGNSFAEMARLEGELQPLPRWPSARLGEADWELPGGAGEPVLAACVVPALRERLGGRWPGRLRWLEPALVPGVDFSGCSGMGADRVANAAAAAALLPLPAIVVDCGTAINFVAVGPGPRFLGGAIMPGRLLLRQSLKRGTAQLPEIELAAAPPAALGTDTGAAIRAGVDLGVLGAVARVLEETRRALPGVAVAVAVGGDAAYFAGRVPGLEPGPRHFTLQGLAAVARGLAGPAAGGRP